MKFLSVVLWPVATGAVAFASLGSCSTADQSVKNPATISIQSDSQDRSFLVWTPPNYNSKTASPVIISYHGGTKTAQDQRELDGLTDAASDTASIVVYPQGIDVSLPLLAAQEAAWLMESRTAGRVSLTSQQTMCSSPAIFWTT